MMPRSGEGTAAAEDSGSGDPLVLFDLDGTLLDPAGAITEGIAEAIEAHGYPRPDEQTLRLFVGPQSEVSLREHTQIPVQDHAAIVRTYRAAYPQRARELSRPYPGVLELLEDLHRRQVPMALATQKPLYIAREVLADAGLSHYFRVLGGAKDPQLPEGVPDPLGADLAQSKAGIIGWCLQHLAQQGHCVDRARTVMVGDRRFDLDGARSNGVPGIGVLWGFGTREELEAAGASALVADADQLAAEIDSWTASGRDQD